MTEKTYSPQEEPSFSAREEMEIDLLLEGVYRLSGYDFRSYMRSSIGRRIQNRLRLEQIPTISGLLEKAIHEPEMLTKLLNDFSINVTEMFRNPSFFKAFREKAVPHLKNFPVIRIWHAGCSTGEEVFSMAILLEEEGLSDRTQIFATDMNERVLNLAKQGKFALNKMQNYTKNYMLSGGSRSFSEFYSADEQYAYIHPELMKNISFAQHNLVTDQSFNEFHVIVCRNVLIYFTGALQNQVHQLFYDSLSDGGFLGLGDKESLKFTEVAYQYQEFDTAEKIYRKLKKA
ncbi:protein-glutamate O-methyltransferase CheR [Bacillus mangrovi]|uniref:Protein-glutamate O-methyltransferase CheR n=1 Tax=Metabacillus mangrovi TaxID=1491830 RepID=A0A7X2S797_9BACI|nr:protein-glutamate O-methyltransferase CheR [Metabacillus mangrovi]MTH54785.1 protein-glutamate O-methyltransferase CheR [Metabacillus mangrovi]